MVDAVIRIFESTATEFETNGLGYLSDAISCEVLEERNGEFELTMKYPTTGIRYNELEMRKIIVVKSNPYSDPQPFRIYEITKPIERVVTVYAEHISYDMSGIPVKPFSAEKVGSALAGLKAYSAVPCPFEFYTDKNTSSNFKISVPKSMKSSLGGSDGSILDVYGGEYEFDAFRVNLWNHRGMNRGVTIRYGKNLTSIEQEENCSNVYTGVYPYWYSDEEGLVELPDKIVQTPGTFNYQKVLVLDLSYEWDTKPTTEELLSRTERYISDNDIGVPKVSIDVSFVNLVDSKEFEVATLLETVHLCDTLTVEFPELGVKATAKCIKTKYDAITGKYISLSLGDAKLNFADTLTDNNDKLADEFDKILDTELGSLKKDVDKDLDDTAAALRKEAEDTAAALKKAQEEGDASIRSDTDQKFEDAENSVNQRFIQVNERFAILDGVIIDLDTDMGQKLESIGQNIDDIEGDISNLFVGLGAANQGIGDINKDLEGIDGDISGLQGSVSSLEKELQVGLETEATNRELAIASATKKITGNLGGYVVLHSSTNADYPDEILIMDTDNINTAKKIWRWNSSGLGYSNTGYNGPYGLAMTNNGVIVADYIQTGVMSADRIKGGTLILGGGNNGNGEFALLDQNNNIIGVMNNAGIQMLRGQIKGPSVMVGGAANGNGIISVFDEDNEIVGLFNNVGVQILKGQIKGPVVEVGGVGNTDGYINVRDGEGNIIGQWSNDGLYAEKAIIKGDVISSKNLDENEYDAKLGLVKFPFVSQEGGVHIVEMETYGFAVNGGPALTQYGLRGVDTLDFQTTLGRNSYKGWFEIIMSNGGDNGSPYFTITYQNESRTGDYLFQFEPASDQGMTVKMDRYSLMLNGANGGLYFQALASSSSGNPLAVEYRSAARGYRVYQTSSSSIRYKEKIRDMAAEDIKNLYNIRPVIAKYKDGILAKDDERYGVGYPMFIAEDVEEYFPYAVDHNIEGQAENWNQRVMIPAMFQMIKSQKEEIDLLKMRIEKLEVN